MRLVDGREIAEHRYVMEQHLGRKLLPTEQVHHRNHNKVDNRVENLEVKSAADHVRDHWSEGYYAAAVAARQSPDRPCRDCGETKHIKGRGLCSRCYVRHYDRARRAAAGQKVHTSTPYF